MSCEIIKVIIVSDTQMSDYPLYRHLLCTRKHVDREDKGVAFCDTLGGRQQTTVLIQHSGSNYKTQAVIITAEGRHY